VAAQVVIFEVLFGRNVTAGVADGIGGFRLKPTVLDVDDFVKKTGLVKAETGEPPGRRSEY